MKKMICTLVAVLLLGFAHGALAGALVLEGENAISVTDISGKVIPGKEFFGAKKTVLLFAQTACANCSDEISAISKIKGDYKNLEFVVVLMNMRADEDRFKAFLSGVGFTGKALADPKWALAGPIGVKFTPATIIVGKDGTVEFLHAGYSAADKDAIVAALKKANG